MPDKVYRILLVDDHEHARLGMREIVGGDPMFSVVAEAADGHEAIRMARELCPDIILMDINMPGLDGLETTKLIKESAPECKIVMVTVSDDVTNLFEAIKRGAQGYLLKNLQPSSWLEYLRAVALDEAPMSKELANRILREFAVSQPAPQQNPLSQREKEVLQLVAKGHSNKHISEMLYISEHTVKNHLKSILYKLQLENRVQLTRYAYEKGWIKG
nr:response regulator transcription factor [Paenibacillus alkalitolerans]